MTEKEFRKIVFETELSSEKKKSFLEKVDYLSTTIENSLPTYLKYVKLSKQKALRNGLVLNGENQVSLNLLIDVEEKYQDISKVLIMNVVHNNLLLNLNCNIVRNSDSFEITYPDNQIIELDINKQEPSINIAEILNNDYPLFKNTIRILKYYLKEQNIDIISDDVLINLLGYSLINHLVDYRYEGYIHAFSKGLDDFLKGLYIDLNDKYYEKYNLTKSYLNKANYTIINFENGFNLTYNISVTDLNEYRKLKKEIQKLVSIAEILVNNKELIIDINPKINPQTKDYQWSYAIDSLNVIVSGGSYKDEKIEQLDAIYKALQRALKVVVEKGLAKSSITLRCKYRYIL